MRPWLALTHRTHNWLVWSSPLVRKILSPHSTGEECPLPGRGIFQLKSCSVHLVGTVLAALSPEPLGPRKRVHSWPRPWGVEARNRTRTRLWRTKNFIAPADESIAPQLEQRQESGAKGAAR